MRTKATITSGGRITIPSEVRKTMGVKEGDYIAFEPSNNGFNLTPIRTGLPFAKEPGTGNSGIDSGRGTVTKPIRKLRGHADHDDE